MTYYRQGPNRPTMQFGVPGLTPGIKKIMIACGVVWAIQIVSQMLAGFALEPLLGVVPSATIRGWLWQPFTYMFLHSPTSPTHILFNMLMLWMFGSELERHWGEKALLRYFVVCGVGAGIFAIVMGLVAGGMAARVPTIGASGAIYGLFMAFGIVFAERTVLFMLIFPMKARTMAMIMFALTFFYLGTGGPNSGVSHIAHLGGAATGFVYLKRVWRVGEFYRELKWKYMRRRFKVMPPPEDDDRWIH